MSHFPALFSCCGLFSRPFYFFPYFTRYMMFQLTKLFPVVVPCRCLGHCYGAYGDQSSVSQSVCYACASDSHSWKFWRHNRRQREGLVKINVSDVNNILVRIVGNFLKEVLNCWEENFQWSRIPASLLAKVFLIQPLSCSGLVVRVLILRLKNGFSGFKSVLKFFSWLCVPTLN